MFRFVLILPAFAILSACATSPVPSGFIYETSVRGEQGFVGTAARTKSISSLLEPGVVTDPAAALQAALPDASVKVRRWGVSYFASNWKRYQVILDADIKRGDEKTKCRLAAPEAAVGALTLKEVHANDGAALQATLETLVTECVAEATAP